MLGEVWHWGKESVLEKMEKILIIEEVLVLRGLV
jgi:hypothetical protein